ncbi:diaminobutyrate acetyltransferase [Streptomyces sp. NPDC020965]|uniref:diaminobutyrate acetyltransferase n=1 Tax=Streptomyces sp. NPDC020965 TaxID=3365105 RepID=UPI0037978420
MPANAPIGKSSLKRSAGDHSGSAAEFTIRPPRVEDGAALWRIARDSKVLALNSPYSYLLWCRDFAGTSLVVCDGRDEPVGFVTGYLRPERQHTLLVWQIAVDAAHRGRRLAGALLDELTMRTVQAHGLSAVETTITPTNTASKRLFTSFAERHGAVVRPEDLFNDKHFPDGTAQEPEVLYHIAPLSS